MDSEIVVFGYGAVGRATTELLAEQGRRIRVAQRSRPPELPAGVGFASCDILDPAAVRAAASGARQIVVAVGLPYFAKVWRELWPLAMTNFLAACRANGARMVFVDNLYMYGPQVEPLREDMPLADTGAKPAVRAKITRQWQSAAGEVRVAALRAADFYGPGVTLSHIGEAGFGALADGKRMTLLAPLDIPHDFAYVADVGRAVASLLDAPDDAFGQAWHAPCAPTRTPREILSLGAQGIGVAPRFANVPLWLLPAMGLASPTLAEFTEMRFAFDRPYRVDWSKFAKRFWSDPTPFETGAPAAAAWFKAHAAA